MSTNEQIISQLLHSNSEIAPKEAVFGDNDGSVTTSGEFGKWLLQQFQVGSNVEDFAVYFLSELRHTADIFQVRSPIGESSKSFNESGEEPPNSLLDVAQVPDLSQASLDYDEKAAFDASNASNYSNTPERSFGQSSYASNSSTPLRGRGRRSGGSTAFASPGTGERSRGSGSSSFCLGDFIIKTDSPKGRGKKRIVPTTISTRVSAGRARGGGGVMSVRSNRGALSFGCGNRAFNHENNILMLTSEAEEIESGDMRAILAARRSLLQDASEVSRELEQGETMAATAARARTPDDVKALPLVDLTQISPFERDSLLRLANIYAQLIEWNLATNVLGELSLLLNLVNASDEPRTASRQLSLDEGAGGDGPSAHRPMQQLLHNATNCVYFALRSLERQRHMLTLLDDKSLGVILSNERLKRLAAPLTAFLGDVHQRKQQSAAHILCDDTVMRFDRFETLTSEETLLRQHFPSPREFEAFKRQRDYFAAILAEWNAKHIVPTWQFGVELLPKIREIFRMSEHWVNMAHLAQLFVAQLLIWSCDQASPEDIGVDVDRNKYSKLAQRMVEPSKFSVDYLFPHKQAFFRDFIIAARSLAFTEQLKLALYAELHSLNNATGQLEPELEDGASDHDADVCVDIRIDPKTMSCLLILAKFSGYLFELPFGVGSGDTTAALLDKKHVMLRNQFPACVNSAAFLAEAIDRGKLLATLPWIVQYLGMLGDVALQLDSTRAATDILFALYIALGVDGAAHVHLTPGSAFIVRCCMGWLLETKPVVAAQYYAYRLAHSPFSGQGRSIESLAFRANGGEQRSSPVADAVMHVACPFLAKFRVSIMPPQYASVKSVSRSGRTRYIATRLDAPFHAPPPLEPPWRQGALDAIDVNRAHVLASAFLRSQDTSTQHLFEFVVNRTYHAFVKDAQQTLLWPSKVAADKEVSALTGVVLDEVVGEVTTIFRRAEERVLVAWNEKMEATIDRRIALCVVGLMPADSKQIVRDTIQKLMVRAAKIEVLKWRDANVTSAFYCRDTTELARRVCRENESRLPPNYTSQLALVADAPSVYAIIDELQMLLHTTSLRPERLTKPEPLVVFLTRLPAGNKHQLPTVYYRLVGHGLVQLMQNVIAQCPALLTPAVVDAVCKFWRTPQLQATFERSSAAVVGGIGGLFDRLLPNNFLAALSARRICFERLTQLLIALIRDELITPNFLNELIMAVFKEDWPSETFNEISQMLSTIATSTESTAGHDDMSSLLFMEAMADMALNV